MSASCATAKSSAFGSNARVINGGSSSKFFRVALPLATILCLLVSRAVFAVGVGAADVRSNLGDQLMVTIPIFNVSNPESLGLSVKSDMFAANPQQRLTAKLNRANSQLSVIVSTDWAVMEPYVEFSLTIQDGSVQHAKDFIVLLEFSPAVGLADPLRVNPAQAESQISDSASALPQPVIRLERARDANDGNQYAARSANTAPFNSSSSAANTDSIMGPYDWAQEGQIPASFGAVLDGQSLWRVARRINQAMGVSVEQMMVALYDNNPNAFYSSSIDSLKAGSFMNIPGEDAVKRYSEVAAQSRLEELSGGRSAAAEPAIDQPLATATVGNNEVGSVADEISDADMPAEVPAADIAKNTGKALFVIGDSQAVMQQQNQDSTIGGLANATEGTESIGGDASRRQGVIDSLSQTIGDLMRDNVDKEQRLLSMEARLKSLEATLDSVGLAEEGATTTLVPEQTSAATTWWLWLLPIFATLGSWLLFRARKDLRSPEPELFDDREFNDIEPHSIHVIGEAPEQHGFEEYDSDVDYSGFRSNRSQSSEDDQDEDEIEGVSYHEFDDDEIAAQVKKDQAESDAIEFDTTNIAQFPRGSQRALTEVIDTFIEERDFSAVRDVLDAARGKELDEPNYHFQRLRILLEKDDEHGFYEYFNMVEAKFQDVDRALKMDLANLVSRLNQN